MVDILVMENGKYINVLVLKGKPRNLKCKPLSKHAICCKTRTKSNEKSESYRYMCEVGN